MNAASVFLFVCFWCSSQWSFVVANTNYNLSWLAGGPCDLSFISSLLMILCTAYWWTFSYPLPSRKHPWNFVFTLCTPNSHSGHLSVIKLLVFPQLPLMYNIITVLMYNIIIVLMYNMYNPRLHVVTHWSFLVVTTYVLCKGIESLNF